MLAYGWAFPPASRRRSRRAQFPYRDAAGDPISIGDEAAMIIPSFLRIYRSYPVAAQLAEGPRGRSRHRGPRHDTPGRARSPAAAIPGRTSLGLWDQSRHRRSLLKSKDEEAPDKRDASVHALTIRTLSAQ